jgi:hypothetical protein
MFLRGTNLSKILGLSQRTFQPPVYKILELILVGFTGRLGFWM